MHKLPPTPEGFHKVTNPDGTVWFEADPTDPIFEAIDRHKAALREFLAAVEVSGPMQKDDPCIDAAEARTVALDGVEGAAAIELTNVVPTTMAGVLALLTHINEFNRGFMDGSPVGTDRWMWPTDSFVNDDVHTSKGGPLEMEWPFWIMRNVETALQNLQAAA